LNDRLDRLESLVAQLSEQVQSLEKRLGALESGSVSLLARESERIGGVAEGATTVATLGGRAQANDPIAVLSLIGRLFLVLAGGFFLRAMTEAGLLAPPVGITAAFVYSIVWLYMADRAGGRGQVVSAAFHAAAFALVAFPLVVEATTRFKVLPAAGAALVLALLTAALVWTAWHRRLQAAAWIAIAAALPTSVVLLLKTGQVLSFALQPVALGVATLWLGYLLGWKGIRWPVALVANLVVAGLALRALMPQHADAVQAAVLMQWALLLAYAAGIAVLTVVRRQSIGWFEAVQSGLVLVVSVGGTILLAGSGGPRATSMGLLALVLGVACYALLYAIFEKRPDSERNVYFYSSLALVLVVVGMPLLVAGPWPGLVFAVLAVTAAVLWAKAGRLYSLLHGAGYLAAAVVVSGGLVYGVETLLKAPDKPWQLPNPVEVVVLVAAVACAWYAAARPAPEGGALASSLRVVVVLACAWVAAECLTGWLAPVTVGIGDEDIEPGALATLRTVVLALGTLVVAWIGRHARFREWAWLVYPLLVVIGLKMIAQDFGQSRPATLFIALALYGAALIVAPRLRRRRRGETDCRAAGLEGEPAT
jgi:hypothetical protein